MTVASLGLPRGAGGHWCRAGPGLASHGLAGGEHRAQGPPAASPPWPWAADRACPSLVQARGQALCLDGCAGSRDCGGAALLPCDRCFWPLCPCTGAVRGLGSSLDSPSCGARTGEPHTVASSFCYGFWIQHIWIPGPRCVVATATPVPLVNTGAHPPQSREQNNCVTFFCHEIEMSSLLPFPHPPAKNPGDDLLA